MEQKILTAPSASELNTKIKEAINEGFTPQGSHQVIVMHQQLVYSGNQHKRTELSHEYSQTVTKP